MKHKTIRIAPPWDKTRYPIDRGIAPLITAAWNLGCMTWASCEDQQGEIAITFIYGKSIERFMLSVIKGSGNYNITRDWHSSISNTILGGESLLLFRVSFPPSQYLAILQAVQRELA